MKPAMYLIPAIGIAVIFLIRAELRGKHRQTYVIKPGATLLVIFAALLSFSTPFQDNVYTAGILAGLFFSLGGDIALMFSGNQKAFKTGLILFLLAHIIYAATFTLYGQLSSPVFFSACLLLIAGAGIYHLIRNNLGRLKIPVIAYIFIISVMVMQAVSILTASSIESFQALTVIGGAVLFYISDVILALNRFWRPWRYNRISLAFYYGGQMLIALSASCFIPNA